MKPPLVELPKGPRISRLIPEGGEQVNIRTRSVICYDGQVDAPGLEDGRFVQSRQGSRTARRLEQLLAAPLDQWLTWLPERIRFPS